MTSRDPHRSADPEPGPPLLDEVRPWILGAVIGLLGLGSLTAASIAKSGALYDLGLIGFSLSTLLIFALIHKYVGRPAQAAALAERPHARGARGRIMADRSSLLMTYTTFHIGVYLTLGGGAIALETQKDIETLVFPFLCFFVAGVAGGVIGSNLPDYEDFDEFKEVKIGFWWFKIMKYECWARLEHAAFWLGLVTGVVILWNAL